MGQLYLIRPKVGCNELLFEVRRANGNFEPVTFVLQD